MAMAGLFLLTWGGWELLETLGVVAEARFPWQLFLVFIGAGMLLGALFGKGWGWMWCDDGEERREPPHGP